MPALTFRDVTFDIQSINNTVYITSTQLSRALDFKRDDAVQKIYIRNREEFLPEMSLLPQIGGSRLFSLRGAHLIAMFSRTPVAKEFRKWVLDVLDKETGSYSKQPEFDLLNQDYFARVRCIANQFIEDWIKVGKGENVTPSLTISDDVLAGIVAQQLSRQKFRLYIDYSGKLSVDVIPNKSPYDGLAKAIADPGNIGLEDEVIHGIGEACVKALAYRAKSRKRIIEKR